MNHGVDLDKHGVLDCPRCGKQPRHAFTGRHVISCCEFKGKGKALSKAVKNWNDAVEAYMESGLTVDSLWDKALGRPSEFDRSRRDAKRLMNNDAVVEKRLNAFHDGRLI